MSKKVEVLPNSDRLATMQALGDEELLGVVHRCLKNLAENTIEMAFALRLLKERKADLSSLHMGNALSYYLKVAYGQIDPEVLRRFSRRPSLIARVGNLDLSEQQSLAAGKPVIVIEQVDGKWTHRLKKPELLTDDEIKMVFDREGFIRDEGQQLLYLNQKASTKARAVAKCGPFKPDLERDGFVIDPGTRFVSRLDVKRALRALED